MESFIDIFMEHDGELENWKKPEPDFT